MSNPLAKIRLPIETPRLILRLPTSGDVPDLLRSFRDRRTARAVGAPLHSLEEMTDPEKLVKRTLREFRSGEHLSLSVVQRETSECIGRVGLRGMDWNWHKVESLSYWIDPRHWDKGYATEASWFLCREAFLRLGEKTFSQYGEFGCLLRREVKGSLLGDKGSDFSLWSAPGFFFLWGFHQVGEPLVLWDGKGAHPDIDSRDAQL